MNTVSIDILVENAGDVWAHSRGRIVSSDVRQAVVRHAVVDRRVTLLCLPKVIVERLGLELVATKRVTASSGPTTAGMYEPVRLTIMGRSCTMDVMEVPDGVPALVGQIPLEHLDFVVDLRNQKLIGNPAHNGEHVYEMY